MCACPCLCRHLPCFHVWILQPTLHVVLAHEHYRMRPWNISTSVRSFPVHAWHTPERDVPLVDIQQRPHCTHEGEIQHSAMTRSVTFQRLAMTCRVTFLVDMQYSTGGGTLTVHYCAVIAIITQVHPYLEMQPKPRCNCLSTQVTRYCTAVGQNKKKGNSIERCAQEDRFWSGCLSRKPSSNTQRPNQILAYTVLYLVYCIYCK